MKTYQQFIGGQWVGSASGETQQVESLQTGKPIQAAFDEMGVASDLSGFFAGIDGSRHALDDYTIVKHVTVNTAI